MKGKVLILLAFFVGVIWIANTAYATPYFVFDQWGGSWYDAEKTVENTEDDLMCWAASASNILNWTGWGSYTGQGFTDEDAIFQYYQDHWTDDGGNPGVAWYWWFYGINVAQGVPGWSQVDAPGGGFYQSYGFPYIALDTTYPDYEMYAMNAIDYFFDTGFGVSLGVYGPNIAHSVTAWGYEKNNLGQYAGIYVTDSDDNKYTSPSYPDSLRYYDVAYNASDKCWYLQDFYGHNDIYIGAVEGLKLSPIPEPSTCLLFLFGLAGMVGVKKKSWKG